MGIPRMCFCGCFARHLSVLAAPTATQPMADGARLPGESTPRRALRVAEPEPAVFERCGFVARWLELREGWRGE